MANDSANDLSASVSQLRSPALSAKTNPTTATATVGLESKQPPSHVYLTALALGRAADTSSPNGANGTNGSLSQSQIFASPTTASPLASAPVADGEVEPHLAGHEPRYFPGVVQRRRGSTRQSSQHESDSKRSTKGKEMLSD